MDSLLGKYTIKTVLSQGTSPPGLSRGREMTLQFVYCYAENGPMMNEKTSDNTFGPGAEQ